MIPSWFDDKWVKDEICALGLFLAVLSLRLDHPYDIPEKRSLYYPFERFKEAIWLRLEEKDYYKSYAVGASFFNSIYENEKDENGVLCFDGRIEILDKIEQEYLELFRDAYLNCIDYKRIRGGKKAKKIGKILKDISVGFYKEEVKTPAGSVKVCLHPYEVKSRMKIMCGEAINLLYIMNVSNIALYSNIYPFPVLEKDFINFLYELE